jgi:3-oxoacyl-[acyl-carrier-protein] synthase II
MAANSTPAANSLVDHRGRPRVAVTGMGMKTPCGNTVEDFWAGLLRAVSVAGRIERFDPSALPFQFACEVKNFDAGDYFSPKEVRRVDRATQLGFAAAADALADAGDVATDPARCGVIAGGGVGGLETTSEQIKILNEKGALRVSPFLVPMMMVNAAAGTIGIELGWTGPNLCVATACAAGSNAIGEGARLIRDGSADVVLAGGTEAAITPIALSAFGRMGALSGRHHDPTHASRPFDADRDGFVLGEGAAFLVLETLEHAIARGAHIYGEIAGYGRNADAHHITAPSPGGVGAAACMQLALDDAGLEPDAISYVNAHGTSTPLNDTVEAAAIRKAFPVPPPVMSIKGVTGHLVAAAGAVEAVTALLSLRDGVAPPTANFERAGDDIELDIVHGEPRPIDAKPVLSNSFGFGGHNATLVIAPTA